jgi:hypothetical protein
MASEPVEGQLLYGIPQGARVLGISTRLLWTYVSRGEVAVRRVNNRTLVHRKELEKFATRDHASAEKAVR